ncbi:DoxX family protein [Aeromicrobium sp. Root495]|uniref:DoxX family protein n=1 Tax=Aeromicrobium sp. Root495 TaxID=1736550 RepID=UPI000B0677EE|nr:DoxX family protein [Aeromicrobium sp. Root495]
MDIDVAATVLRVVLGVTFVLHGWNHGFGGGGIEGTAGWFESIGLRPARVHALVSTYLEIAAGLALVVGLFTPLAASAAIGVMLTAFVTVHARNGFFIFKDGYEYVLVIVAALVALATIGPGRMSLDHALGTHWHGWEVGAGALGLAVVGTALMLVVSWRPPRT